jgi:anti-sigma regulatory factor (Ser/Thr protein kinase)
MRSRLAQVAAALPVDDGWLALVATELVINALAVSPKGAVVELVVFTVDDGSIEVVVTDRGPGPPPLPACTPPLGSPRGRGLFLVEQLSDAFTFERQGDHTLARCRRSS